MAGRVEGQSVDPGRILVVRTRRPSSELSPEELLSRLIYARKGTGKPVTYRDYCKARGGSPDIDLQTFEELLPVCKGDPGFSWRKHVFRPTLRDSEGRTYEILEHFPDRIGLLRDDGVSGYTTPEEFRSFFFPIEETSLPDRTLLLEKTDINESTQPRRDHEQ